MLVSPYVKIQGGSGETIPLVQAVGMAASAEATEQALVMESPEQVTSQFITCTQTQYLEPLVIV